MVGNAFIFAGTVLFLPERFYFAGNVTLTNGNGFIFAGTPLFRAERSFEAREFAANSRPYFE
jgi:hypothetical protein